MGALWRMAFRVAFLIGIGLTLGCTSDWATVSGVVTLDDKPLETGGVTFFPVEEGPLAYGQIGAGGVFVLYTGQKLGLAPGEYLVTVVASEPPSDPNSPEPGKLLTPLRYRDKDESKLKYQLNPGKNRLAIPLYSN